MIPLVHDELHCIARRCMAGEKAGHSLQATALVNEAYLRLIDVRRINWQDRAHFLAMSARLMRRILIDAARAKGYRKRGGGAVRVTFLEDLPVGSPAPRYAVASAADASMPAGFELGSVAMSDIACRVLDLCRARGRRDGHAVGGWLQTERELQRDRKAVAKS